jgi:SAM-dependent methyltransferase
MKGQRASLEDIISYLATVSVEEDEVDEDVLSTSHDEMNAYRISHARRFWRSLRLIQQWAPPARPLRVLEIGAAPYYFSALLSRFANCQVTGANTKATVWPGAESANPAPRDVALRHGEPPTVERITVHVFNIEKDPFPFDDSAFDLVLCMEVIEHLAYSPTHMLAEMHRVLRPGGRLLLSTPNATDLRRTLSHLVNWNPAFHYSGYGIYGRHNREFTAAELRLLISACGYRILESRLENVFIRSHYALARRLAFKILQLATDLPLPYLKSKREYIFVVAESTGAPVWAYPPRLYYYPHLYPNGPSDENSESASARSAAGVGG